LGFFSWGERDTFYDFFYENLEHDQFLLSNYSFNANERNAIRVLLENGFTLIKRKYAYLAHGDFDLTHIFQRNGHYTGIIDFGEIMGSSPFYDLGHFKLHDGSQGT
jgi:hypothetical protein